MDEALRKLGADSLVTRLLQSEMRKADRRRFEAEQAHLWASAAEGASATRGAKKKGRKKKRKKEKKKLAGLGRQEEEELRARAEEAARVQSEENRAVEMANQMQAVLEMWEMQAQERVRRETPQWQAPERSEADVGMEQW